MGMKYFIHLLPIVTGPVPAAYPSSLEQTKPRIQCHYITQLKGQDPYDYRVVKGGGGSKGRGFPNLP